MQVHHLRRKGGVPETDPPATIDSSSVSSATFLRRRPAPRDLAQERFELEFAQPQAHADIVAVKHVDAVLARRVEHVPPRVTRQQLARVFDATLLVHHECDCVVDGPVAGVSAGRGGVHVNFPRDRGPLVKFCAPVHLSTRAAHHGSSAVVDSLPRENIGAQVRGTACDGNEEGKLAQHPSNNVARHQITEGLGFESECWGKKLDEGNAN